MFKTNKKNTYLWVTLVIVAILVVISMLLQAQILSILSDMHTFILKYSWVMDTNPLPAMPGEVVMDSNPLPIRTF
jgi:hypothetical protein